MISSLAWVGARARWVLFVGAFVGLAAPDLSAVLRPALPFFVAMVYALAMLRVDPIAILRGLARPRRAAIVLGGAGLMLVAAPVAAFAAARLLGLGPEVERILVYTFAAPPIASAAAICLIIGFRAALALELTIVASLIMPFTGPLVVEALIGAEVALDPVELSLRMAAMIFGGFAAAMIGRWWMGRERIARNAPSLDGLAALGFLLFILPLFDGARDAIAAAPLTALGYFALAAVAIFGTAWIALRFGQREPAGAVGVVAGTRSVAIFLAALPPDPAFALYVALYQFPMAWLAIAFRKR
ncbi:MAG: hypothetical protein AAFN79_10360 [Pseudomonadota bacterium]